MRNETWREMNIEMERGRDGGRDDETMKERRGRDYAREAERDDAREDPMMSGRLDIGTSGRWERRDGLLRR